MRREIESSLASGIGVPTVLELIKERFFLALAEKLLAQLSNDHAHRLVSLCGLTEEYAAKSGGFEPRSDELRVAVDSSIAQVLHRTTFLDEFVSSSIDPTILGWAYQYWNQPERDESTWAVSRGDTEGVNEKTLSYATQVYTESYMAKFLARECIHQLGNNSRAPIATLTYCDPACGAGNILLAIFSELHRVAVESPPISESARPSTRNFLRELCLFGVDIDPLAVKLARVSLVIAAIQLETSSQDIELFASKLRESIVSLPAPLGTLSRKSHMPGEGHYDAIITNPPYVGRRKLNGQLRDYLSTHYECADGDIASAFTVRCLELLREGGQFGVVTSDKWLRLKTYRSFRWSDSLYTPGIFSHTKVFSLIELGSRAFHRDADLHDGVGVTLLHVERSLPRGDHRLAYLDLSEKKELISKVEGLSLFSTARESQSIEIQQSLFATKEPSQVLFSASTGGGDWKDKTIPLKSLADVVIGIQTNDDRRFVTLQGNISKDDTDWIVHHRGGGVEPWYGLNRWMLNISALREHLRGDKDDPFPIEESFAREGWTYSWFANGKLALRKKERGWSFGRAAASAVFVEDFRVVGYLNAPIASQLARKLAGKVQFTEGVIREVPVPRDLSPISAELVLRLTEIVRILSSQDIREFHFDPTFKLPTLERFALEREYLEITARLELQVQEAARGAALVNTSARPEQNPPDESIVLEFLRDHESNDGDDSKLSVVRLNTMSRVPPSQIFEILSEWVQCRSLNE